MQQFIYLPVGGAVPGIPGDHGPGTYLVDWTERTITPVNVNVQPSAPPTEQPVEDAPTSEQPE